MKNIIKKLIVSFCFAFILMLLKGDFLINAKAMTVSGQNVGAQTWSVNPSTNYWYVNKSIDNYWNGWGSGYVYFNIGISKRSTDSVTPLVSPKSIVLSSGTTSFACSMGTNSVNNSTYINQNYSVVCPVNFSSSGLTLLTINLMPLNNTPVNTYEIYFDGFMSFVNDSPDVNVSVDNSSSDSNRDQNFGNLITDNRNNTNTIIQNNDDNANKITGSVDKNTEENKKTNDFIMDDTEPNSDISSLGNVQGLLPPGPVDSLLNIPFKFLSVIVSSLGDLCVPLSGKFVFNSTLTLPCFTSLFYDRVPSSLMIFINLIPSAFILINYLKHLYKKVDRAMSMETTSDDEWGVL